METKRVTRYIADCGKGLSEADQSKILHPPACAEQCFDCMAIVGERRLKIKTKTKKLNNGN
jgi:hypothetical protein